MRSSPSSASKTLRHAAAEASGFLNEIAEASDRLAGRTSETLCGTFGGSIGAGIGYAVVIGADLPLGLVPIALGAAFGIVSAILMWRGPSRIILERRRKFAERDFAERLAFSKQQKKLIGSAGSPELLAAIEMYPLTGILPGDFLHAAHNIESNRLTSLPSSPSRERIESQFDSGIEMRKLGSHDE